MEGTQTTQMPIIQQPVGGNSQSNLCQAALQDAMEKCNTKQQQPGQDTGVTMSGQVTSVTTPGTVTSDTMPGTVTSDTTPGQVTSVTTLGQDTGDTTTEHPPMIPGTEMDTPMMPEQVMEGFQSEMALPKPSPTMVNNLMNALLMMCLFYLLSHKETYHL